MITRHLAAVGIFLATAGCLAAQTKDQKSSAADSGRVRFINPPGLAENPRYSHVVEITKGRLVLISGQVAFDKSGSLVGKGDMRAQTTQVFENLKAALDSVGATFNDVVKLNSFLVNMPENLPAYREVRAKYLADNKHQPTSTTVGVAALVTPDLLLEMEAEVVLPERKN
jgi:enamine deaminase RidA (YjgF/YER057c/UK114 family)